MNIVKDATCSYSILNSKLEVFCVVQLRSLIPIRDQMLVTSTYGYVTPCKLFFFLSIIYIFIYLFILIRYLIKLLTSLLSSFFFKSDIAWNIRPTMSTASKPFGCTFIFLVTTILFACLINTKPKSLHIIKCISREFFFREKSITKHLHALSLWWLMNQKIYIIGLGDKTQL